MLPSLSSVPPVCPRPRPEIIGTKPPQAATTGARMRLTLSPTPPVECLSRIGPPRSGQSRTVPERDMARVSDAHSPRVMPRKYTAIAKGQPGRRSPSRRRSLPPDARSRPRSGSRRRVFRGSAPRPSPGSSHPLEHVGPFLQHLGISVAHGEADVVESGPSQLAEPFSQLGLGSSEGGRANELRGADRVLFRSQEHQVPAMVAQIAGIRGLVREIDLAISLDQRRELRW